MVNLAQSNVPENKKAALGAALSATDQRSVKLVAGERNQLFLA